MKQPQIVNTLFTPKTKRRKMKQPQIVNTLITPKTKRRKRVHAVIQMIQVIMTRANIEQLNLTFKRRRRLTETFVRFFDGNTKDFCEVSQIYIHTKSPPTLTPIPVLMIKRSCIDAHSRTNSCSLGEQLLCAVLAGKYPLKDVTRIRAKRGGGRLRAQAVS